MAAMQFTNACAHEQSGGRDERVRNGGKQRLRLLSSAVTSSGTVSTTADGLISRIQVATALDFVPNLARIVSLPLRVLEARHPDRAAA
ncbi:MAG: hypothetical protein R3B91_16045 [Planctomycetaceae bacterium]